MLLAEQLHGYTNAAFTGLWVQTHEPDEAEREIFQHAREHQWRVAVWDVAHGLRVPGTAETPAPDAGGGDPLAALRSLAALADPNGTAVLLLHNFHRFLTNPEIIQAMFGQLLAGKERRTFVVVLSPVVQIPIELEKLFVVIEHALPDREQLRRIATELTSEQPGDLPAGDGLERVLDAAAGLTRYEAEGAFALSLTRHNELPPEFTRAERLDAVFFLDLPGVQEKRAIWELYMRQFSLLAQPKPVDADWTPAEIRACCRLAALLGSSLVEAAQTVVPVARTAEESVERLRSWASGRCLSADQPGIFNRQPMAGTKPGRRVRRDPSQN